MAAPNEEEKQLLLEFRKRIPDLPLTELEQHDMYLITWIRAREHDLKKAEEMLRKNFEWRRTNSIDTMLETWKAPPSYSTRYPYEITGHDDQDCPIVVCKFGSWNVRKALDDGESEAFLRYLGHIVLFVQDHVKKMIEVKKEFISQFVLILDLKGFSYRQLASIKTVEVYMNALREFEANYPETLKSCIVVNVNKFAVIGYNLVKPLLSKRTLAKVELYDSNVSNWRTAILSKNPSHAIPVYYGGTNHVKISGGGDLNRNFSEDVNNDDRLTTVTVEAGGQLIIEHNVEQPSTIISWKFKTTNHNIGFSVRYNDRKEIVPYAKHDAWKNIQENSILCDAIGKYSLIFDNKYSRFRSKILEYCINVESGEP